MGRLVTRFITETGGESLTKQSFKKSADINDIVARARKIGSMDPLRPRTVPKFMDCTEVPNFQEAMKIVIQANEMLMALSPNVRERFSNDPEKMIQFLANPENQAEAVKLGLMVEKPKPEPEKIQKVEVVNKQPEAGK